MPLAAAPPPDPPHVAPDSPAVPAPAGTDPAQAPTDPAHAPAEAARQPANPPRRSPWRLLVPMVFASAGLLFSVSFQTAAGTGLRSDRTLPDLIDSANRDVAARSSRLTQLQAEVDKLTEALAPRDSRVAALTAEAGRLAVIAGTQAVTGPAITVVLDDSPRQLSNLPDTVRPDDLVVHQQDVQAVVNALWRGGAEAMMIQDQRVISTSAVRCVGNTLILQGRVYSPPFTISAIGPTRAMQSALDDDPQISIYQEWVDVVGLGYDVSTSGSASFPAYTGSVQLSYTKVAR